MKFTNNLNDMMILCPTEWTYYVFAPLLDLQDLISNLKLSTPLNYCLSIDSHSEK